MNAKSTQHFASPNTGDPNALLSSYWITHFLFSAMFSNAAPSEPKDADVAHPSSGTQMQSHVLI